MGVMRTTVRHPASGLICGEGIGFVSANEEKNSQLARDTATVLFPA